MAQYESQIHEGPSRGSALTKIAQQGDVLNAFLSTKMANEFSHVPAAKTQNRLNQWIDLGDQQNNMVAYATKLGSNELTLADWKRKHLAISYADFWQQLPHIIKEVLRLLLYVEQGKEWYFPIDPLNIIYDENTQRCRVFYRYTEPLKNIQGDWIEDTIKIIYYLCSLDTNNSTMQFATSNLNQFWTNFLYNNDPNSISDYQADVTRTYGATSVANIANFAYTLTANTDQGPTNQQTIEDFLQREPLQEGNPTGGVIISEVSDDHDQYIDVHKIPVHNENRGAKYPDARRKGGKPKGKKGKTPVWLILLVLALLGGGGYYWYSHNTPTQPQQPQQSTSSKKDSNPKDDPDFYNGLLDAAANDNDAGEDFDKYFSNGGSADNLSKSEIAAVFAAYLKDKKYNQILQNIGSEKTATALVKYLLSQNDTDSIKHLNNDNGYKIISFAKADANGNQQKMVSLADDVDLSDNQKYQDDLCKAFAQTNELSKGKEWANSQTNSSDLINAIKNYAYQQPNADKNQINKKLGVTD